MASQHSDRREKIIAGAEILRIVGDGSGSIAPSIHHNVTKQTQFEYLYTKIQKTLNNTEGKRSIHNGITGTKCLSDRINSPKVFVCLQRRGYTCDCCLSVNKLMCLMS